MNNSDEFEILNLTELSDGIAGIFCSQGTSFYIRFDYLETVAKDRIKIGEKFSSEEWNDIINAALCFAAETKATEYLCRAEQCHFKLAQKLVQKKMEKSAVNKVLDYLEQKNLLNDERYCSLWLQDHTMFKFQGRTRLLSELLSRGIDNRTAKKALDSFFSENSEEDFCKKAYRSALRQGKSSDKLLKFMLDAGFSYKLIQKTKIYFEDANHLEEKI